MTATSTSLRQTFLSSASSNSVPGAIDLLSRKTFRSPIRSDRCRETSSAVLPSSLVR
jgi:hypothetical protein